MSRCGNFWNNSLSNSLEALRQNGQYENIAEVLAAIIGYILGYY